MNRQHPPNFFFNSPESPPLLRIFGGWVPGRRERRGDPRSPARRASKPISAPGSRTPTSGPAVPPRDRPGAPDPVPRDPDSPQRRPAPAIVGSAELTRYPAPQLPAVWKLLISLGLTLPPWSEIGKRRLVNRSPRP